MDKGSSGRKALFILFTFIIVFAMLALVYSKFSRINEITAQLAAESIALQQDKDRLAGLQALKSNEAEIREKYEAAIGMLPEEPREDSLIRYIRQKAGLAMADFVEIRFGQREQAGSYADMPVDIVFSGGYKNLVTFLKALESGERALRIDTMTVGVTGEGNSNIRADIGAHGFYMSSDAARQTGEILQ